VYRASGPWGEVTGDRLAAPASPLYAVDLAAEVGQPGVNSASHCLGRGQCTYRASVPDLLREGAWIIEWSQADAPIDVLAQLVPMQLELGLLRSAWDQALRPSSAAVLSRLRHVRAGSGAVPAE